MKSSAFESQMEKCNDDEEELKRARNTSICYIYFMREKKSIRSMKNLNSEQVC